MRPRGLTGEVAVSNNATDARQRHWEKTRNLTIIVLVLWAIFGIVLPFMASSLNLSLIHI